MEPLIFISGVGSGYRCSLLAAQWGGGTLLPDVHCWPPGGHWLQMFTQATRWGGSGYRPSLLATPGRGCYRLQTFTAGHTGVRVVGTACAEELRFILGDV